MITKIKNRMASEQGFTLIELLVVIVILGILVAIAVPSYLGFRGNASQAAAEANVRSAIPAAEGWYQDPAGGNGSYYGHGVTTSMTAANLATEAPGIAPSVTIESLNGGQGYCLDDTNSGKSAYYIGGVPGALGGDVQSVVTTGSTCAADTTLVTP